MRAYFVLFVSRALCLISSLLECTRIWTNTTLFCVRQHSNPVFSFLRVPLSAMKKFLATVDATPRDEGYLDRVVAALAANEVHIVEDLVGLDFGVLKEIPTGGVGAFIVRALRKANSPTASQPSQSAGPPVAAEALQSLLASVKTEPKPHVNLLEQLSRRHLGDLNASCLPDGEVVDDLEAEIRKLRKKGIAKRTGMPSGDGVPRAPAAKDLLIFLNGC